MISLPSPAQVMKELLYVYERLRLNSDLKDPTPPHHSVNPKQQLLTDIPYPYLHLKSSGLFRQHQNYVQMSDDVLTPTLISIRNRGPI
jgi:hypothetical protein